MKTLRFIFSAVVIETIAIGLIVLLLASNPARHAEHERKSVMEKTRVFLREHVEPLIVKVF